MQGEQSLRKATMLCPKQYIHASLRTKMRKLKPKNRPRCQKYSSRWGEKTK
jgi:hypothetical protein